MLSTPSCMSLRSIKRDSSSGPISEIVARIGWPCSPNTSQKITGKLVGLIVDADLLGALDEEILGFARTRRGPRGRP